MLASVVETEMKPSPLPLTLPEGTTANDGGRVLRGEAQLKDFSESMVGYKGRWLRSGSNMAQDIIIEIGEIDWPKEGSAPAERRSAEETMSHDSPDPELEALDGLRNLIAGIKGWPLDKRETFAAFNMMGLSSRLQPLHLESAQKQELVVDLSFRLADLAIAKSEAK